MIVSPGAGVGSPVGSVTMTVGDAPVGDAPVGGSSVESVRMTVTGCGVTGTALLGPPDALCGAGVPAASAAQAELPSRIALATIAAMIVRVMAAS